MRERAALDRVGVWRSPDVANVVFVLLFLSVAALAGVAVALGAWELGLAMALAIPAATVILRYPWSAILIFLAVIPLLAETGDPDAPASPAKWLVARLMIPGIVLVVLLYRMLGLSRSRFRLSLTDAALVAFIALALANIVLLSNNPTRQAVAFYDSLFVPICLYWLVRLIDPREEDLRRLALLLVAVVAFQVVIGFLAWVAPGILPSDWLGRAGERTVGTLGGPGPYTATLVFGALIILQVGMSSRAPTSRLVAVLVAAAAMYAVLLSFSRGSWLGAAAVLVGLFFVYRRFTLQMIGLSLVLALAAAAIGPLSGQFGFALERLGDDDTAASRIVTNDAAVRMIQTEPLLGFGYGNFERFDESFKQRVGDLPAQEGSAHNTYLALAAENGLPALVLYLFPAVWLLILTLRRWSRFPRDRVMNRTLVVLAWLSAIDIAIISNFTDIGHSSAFGTSLWFLSLALIHVMITRASLPVPAARAPWETRTLAPRPTG